MGYVDNIEERTESNSNFRQVLYTGKYMQLVVMCLKPGEDIGEEVHNTVDQFFRVEQGEAKVVMNGEESILSDSMVAIVPAGTLHNVINTSQTDELKLYTIYAPSNHPEGTVHATKQEAMAGEQENHI